MIENLNFTGYDVRVSHMLPKECKTHLKLSEDVLVSPAFRAAHNFKMIRLFGSAPVMYTYQSSLICNPEAFKLINKALDNETIVRNNR